MEDQMETSCFSCFCLCSCPGKKHSKLSHSEKRGSKFRQHIIRQTLSSSSGSSEGLSGDDQSFSSNDIGNPNPNYQASYQNANDSEISEICVADDKEVIPFTLCEHEGHESDISHESSIEIARSRYSEASNQTIYRECREELSSDGTPRSGDSEFSHQKLRDDSLNDTESMASSQSFRIEIPMGLTGSETQSHKSCRHVISSSRGGSEISHVSYGDEKQKYREYESSHKTSKLEIPIAIKDSETSCQHSSCRDGIFIHRSYDRGQSERSSCDNYSGQSEGSSCDNDNGQSEGSSCDNEKYACKYIRKPIPRDEKTYGNPKDIGISKIVFADDEEAKQYTMNEQDGEESEISHHGSHIIEKPRSRESKTGSEISSQESCGDGILARRHSEISPNSYRDENPRFRESKIRHKMSKIVFAVDKDLKQYTMSEHDGEASEISSHESFSVEHDGEESEISSHENYSVEHDGVESEISSHESYSVGIPRSRDFETRSQNSHTDGITIRQDSEICQKSFRDRIPTSRDTEISHESDRAEKPRQGKFKTNHKSPNTEIPMPIRHNETKGQKRSWRKEQNICGGSVNRPKSSWRDALSILRFAQFSLRKSTHEFSTSRESKISQKSYKDEKGPEIRENCRDRTPIYIESSGTRDEFEDHQEKAIIIRPFGDCEDYAEIIRQMIRQFFAEGGLRAAEVLGIAHTDCMAPLEYQESVQELAQTHE